MLWIPTDTLGQEALRGFELRCPERHERDQAEQRGCRAQDGQIRPLPLGFQAEMPAGFLEGGLDPPAADEPAQDVHRGGIQVGAQESLWLFLTLWIAHQHPADRHLHARVMPERSAGSDVEPALAPAIPAIDPDPAPGCGGVGQALPQAREARALAPWSSERAGLPGWGRLVQASVEPQPRDHAQVPPDIAQELDGGKAAVPHRDHPPSWQPAYRLQQPLPGPVGQLLMPVTSLSGIAFGGREHGQEGQSPHAPGPRDRGEQHHAQPAQAAGFDKVAMAGPHRIPIDPARLDLGPPAPLDRVIKADHTRSLRHEGSNEEHQKPVRDGAGGPAPQPEPPVVGDEPRLLVDAHDAQRRRDRPPARGENDTRDQDQNVAPDRGGEEATKGLHPHGQHRGHARRHGTDLCLGGCSRGPTLASGGGHDGRRECDARADRRPPWPRGGVEVIRANRGYTLYSRRTGGPVARLRPTGKEDNVQVLWWRREAWAAPEYFRPFILPLDEALDWLSSEGFFG